MKIRKKGYAYSPVELGNKIAETTGDIKNIISVKIEKTDIPNEFLFIIELGNE